MPVLFTVETPRARLVWSGPEAPGAAPMHLSEETTYSVWLESLDSAPVRLVHADPALTAALAPARGGTIAYGPVRFGSVAGQSRFGIETGGVVAETFTVTVAPTKMTRDDVRAMRAALRDGLALAALRPASEDAEADTGRASAPAFLALLRDAVPRLERAAGAIARDPETATGRALAQVRPHALRRASAETVRALRGAAVWPERVPGRPARSGLDTPAHRWLAARLDAVRGRARAVLRQEAARPPSPRRAAVVAEVERLVGALDRTRRLPPFAEARGAAPGEMPRSLYARPAYAEAAEQLRRLAGALRLASGEGRATVQDLSALYEAWAALETVAAFARAVGAEAPDRPFGVRTVGADVRLGHGERAAVRLRGARGEAEVVRQPRFAGPPALLVQIPDLLVTLRGATPRRVVLDAKYRVQGAAPPGDALGALHRYRDAIVGPDGRALVSTAAVLFPLRPEAAFEASRVWTSLAEIGVGAIPLLPGATGWLDRFARRVVRGEAL